MKRMLINATQPEERRLAIVDLPCGWQPLEDEADGDLLVYNGEVYNHIELREELRAQGVSFETSSDTEVVLRLLERDGLDALRLFNGQFAFALYDRSNVPSLQPISKTRSFFLSFTRFSACRVISANAFRMSALVPE